MSIKRALTYIKKSFKRGNFIIEHALFLMIRKVV